MQMTHQEFVQSRHDAFQRNVTVAVKALIEAKHLYQSVLVPATDSYHVVKPDQSKVLEHMPSVTKAMNANWAVDAVRPGANPVHLKVPDVKVFCSRCKRIEAYNSVLVEDV